MRINQDRHPGQAKREPGSRFSLKFLDSRLRGNDNCLGFTLLELLLVIVILGIMASMGIALYQRNAVDMKVQKTSSQIQQIMQAASAYYSDNGCWPGSTLCTTNPPSFNNYLPAGINTNPWGNAYKWNAQSSGQKFQVYSGNLPSPTFITQLTALLPNAAVDPANSNQVLAEITTPTPLNTQGLVITKLGYTDKMQEGDTLKINFTCPRGWIAKAAAVPYYLELPIYGGGYLCRDKDYSRGIAQMTLYMSCNGSNPAICSGKVNFNSMIGGSDWQCIDPPTQVSSGNYVKFFYMGWCYNPALYQGKQPPQLLF